MKKILFLIIAASIISCAQIVQAQDNKTAPNTQQPDAAVQKEQPKTDDKKPAPSDKKTGSADEKSAAGSDEKQVQPAPKDEIVKKDLGGADIYFNLTYLNLFDYGIGFVFGFDPTMYGFSGILGYRHINTFKGFPGAEGGTCVALDLFVDAGATIASIDGESIVAGYASLTLASNIMWFKSLAQGNIDRTGNGIYIGAKIEASYSKEGFRAGYGPAIGWTMLYYNTEKKKFRTTNLCLFFYPSTMTLGISATTNF